MFLKSLDIASSALTAQRLRIDIISQNIANQNNYNTTEEDTYRRQLVVFEEKKGFTSYLTDATSRYRPKGVQVYEVVDDMTPLTPVYDPENPVADENGYIWYPNVSNTKEQIDLLEATNSYNANLTVANAFASMASKALQIGK